MTTRSPRFAAAGMVASMQPLFDDAWGGPDGLYARRLGADRAAAMNPFATMARAGVALAFGSDAPVTAADPWAAVQAAAHHRTPGQRTVRAGGVHRAHQGRASSGRPDGPGDRHASASAHRRTWRSSGPANSSGRPPTRRSRAGRPTRGPGCRCCRT